MLAAFSRPAKVDSGTFTSWLNALKASPHTVLLLIDFNAEGVRGMRRAAASEGLHASRIVSVPVMAEGK